jgi:hypothetical protein
MSANVDPSFYLATVQKEEINLVPQMKARTTMCGQPKYLSDYQIFKHSLTYEHNNNPLR